VRGRHRPRRGPRTGLQVFTAVAVLAVLAGGWGGYRLLTRASCSGQVPLVVAAAPEIAPVVQDAAARWTAAGPSVRGRCITVDVSPADPADVASAVAGKRGMTLAGVGQANGNTRVPDVWLPDSSMWLARIRSVSADLVPAAAPSLASSPVVLAMPAPIASSLGWPAAKLTWTALLQKMTTDSKLHPGLVDPGRDSSGLSGLIALGAAAGASGAGAQQVTIAGLRALATGRSLLRDDLLRRFPRAGDAATISSALSAAPLAEQTVISYNAGQPPVPLAAVFIDPLPVALDYPYVPMSGLSADQAAAAGALRARMSGGEFRDELARQGLRAPDGGTGNGFQAGPGTPKGAPRTQPVPDAAAIERTLSTWDVVTLPARILAVIDVSGSMLTPVPTAGGATREQVTVEAARRGLALFDDTWAVGLWIFSTLLDGANDYRELVPIGPVASQRGQLQGALGTIKPKPTGDTGLYDTILAAYRTVQAGWDPGRVNSVVILTDGENDDAQGVSLDQLVVELQRIGDPKRPVQVVAIGIGTNVGQAELTKITKTTGGGVFVATDPAKIGEIFLKAIALRSTPR
jgi:Ca-activated chloride channel family protein